jgi:succinoglycan biosynthesis transport protein ExoP
MDNTQLTPFDSFGDSDGNSSLARNDAQGGDIVGKIHKSLRGRYWIIIPLSLLAGAAGGYFGYKSQKPVWKSDGDLQILPSIDSPLANTPHGVIPQYDQWMLAQTTIMANHTIVDMALQDPVWQRTGRGANYGVYLAFVAGLTVDHPMQTQIIHVACTDSDPGVAASATKAIITAYEKFFNERQRHKVRGDLNTLTETENGLMKDIGNDRDAIRAISREVAGSSNFDVFYNLKVNQVAALKQKWNDAKLAIAMCDPNQGAGDLIDQVTNNQIGMLDPRMADKQARREVMVRELEQLMYKLGEKNQIVIGKKVQIEQFDEEINQYAKEYRDLQRKMSANQLPGQAQPQGGFQLFGKSRAALMQQEQAIHDLLIKEEQDMRELGAKQMEVQKIQQRLDDNNKRFADIERQISNYLMNSNDTGQLSVISYGELPVTPFKDRRKFMGAAAGIGGALAPVLFVICLGIFDRRYRYSDEAEGKAGQPPLLGILPTLPDHLADPEQAAIAAHCIHQIRIMLQVGSPLSGQPQEAKRVFMITSSNTGDGKTSLTMALGLSFAASGSRTLVIDCDMVGQGLTHRLKASQSPGLHECLASGSLQGRVKKTTTANLYILPIGGCDAAHAGSLSPTNIKRLLAEAKKVFDIVVIDTGPILGSLEACVVGTAADAVVLAVSRGQNQPMVERAVKQLRSVGANIAGIVFNRAEKRDFNRSVGSASIRSQSVQPVAPKVLISEGDDSSRFGPLARSVASFMPGMGGSAAPAENADASALATSSAAGTGRDDALAKKKRRKDRVSTEV